MEGSLLRILFWGEAAPPCDDRLETSAWERGHHDWRQARTDITETLDEGYQFEGSAEFDSGPHTGIITSITDADNVTIKASGNNLQFSLNGSDWTNITTNAQTINANFTNLQIRTNLELSNRTISRTITLEATPSNSAFQNIIGTIDYTSTINNVSLSASKDIDEVIEAGSTGAEYSFDVSYENLKSIAISVKRNKKQLKNVS